MDYFPENRKDWAYERLLGSLKVRAGKLGIPTINRIEEIEKKEKVNQELEEAKQDVIIKEIELSAILEKADEIVTKERCEKAKLEEELKQKEQEEKARKEKKNVKGRSRMKRTRIAAAEKAKREKEERKRKAIKVPEAIITSQEKKEMKIKHNTSSLSKENIERPQKGLSQTWDFGSFFILICIIGGKKGGQKHLIWGMTKKSFSHSLPLLCQKNCQT